MPSCTPNFGDLVREGFALRVWIVSPTTCMATLTRCARC